VDTGPRGVHHLALENVEEAHGVSLTCLNQTTVVLVVSGQGRDIRSPCPEMRPKRVKSIITR